MAKDFKTPAAQFFNDDNDSSTAAAAETVTENEPTVSDTLTPPEGYKINPYYIEKKSQRVQLVMKPSIYKRSQKAAKKQKISFNELVHQVLETYLNEFEKEKKK